MYHFVLTLTVIRLVLGCCRQLDSRQERFQLGLFIQAIAIKGVAVGGNFAVSLPVSKCVWRYSEKRCRFLDREVVPNIHEIRLSRSSGEDKQRQTLPSNYSAYLLERQRTRKDAGPSVGQPYGSA